MNINYQKFSYAKLDLTPNYLTIMYSVPYKE